MLAGCSRGSACSPAHPLGAQARGSSVIGGHHSDLRQLEGFHFGSRSSPRSVFCASCWDLPAKRGLELLLKTRV